MISGRAQNSEPQLGNSQKCLWNRIQNFFLRGNISAQGGSLPVQQAGASGGEKIAAVEGIFVFVGINLELF